MDQNCLKCGDVLFKKVLLDDQGNAAMDVNTPLDLEWESGDQFFRCPHCSAKNVVVGATSPSGLPAFRVSQVKE